MVSMPSYPWSFNSLTLSGNFNSFKSNIKFLEYTACGFPVIASKAFQYKETINPGQTGYVAKRYIDWYNYIKKLIDSEEERKRIRENALIDMNKEYFNIRLQCQRQIDFYCNLCGKEKLVVPEVEEEELFKRFVAFTKDPSVRPQFSNDKHNFDEVW